MSEWAGFNGPEWVMGHEGEQLTGIGLTASGASLLAVYKKGVVLCERVREPFSFFFSLSLSFFLFPLFLLSFLSFHFAPLSTIPPTPSLSIISTHSFFLLFFLLRTL